LAQGLKKDVGGRFRYAVGLQSWVNYTILMFFLWETHRKPIDSLESRRLAEAGARIGKVPRPESDPKRQEKTIGEDTNINDVLI